MKTTKFLFSMMCTAAILGACSSDEFVNEGTTSLTGRKALNVTLTTGNIVDENGDATTRLGAEVVGNSMIYSWTEDDRIGAALLDGGTKGTFASNNEVTVNYPFDFTIGAEEASSFTAKSPIMEGAYMFYYQYKPTTTRGPLTLAIESQQEYVASKGTAANQMAKYYVGVSPIINLSKGISMDGDQASLTLPLKFKKLNSTIKLAVTPKDLPAGTQITKIELIPASGKFTMGAVYKIPTGDVDVSGSGNATEAVDNDDLADNIKETRDGMTWASVFSGSPVNPVESENISVSMYADADKQAAGQRGVALTNGTAFDAYIVVPEVGEAKEYTVKVYTTEGYLTFDVDETKLESGKVYASAFKFDLKKENLVNYESFDINAAADWDDAVNYVTTHAADYIGKPIVFNVAATNDDAPIYASTLPTFEFTLAGVSAGSTLVLGKKDGSVSSFDLSKTNIKLDDAYMTFVVGKGATVNFNKAFVGGNACAVINNGTLNVGIAAPAGVVSQFTNNKTMSVNVAQATDIVITNSKSGSLSFAAGTSSKKNTYNVALTNNNAVSIPANAIVAAATMFSNAKAAGNNAPTPIVTVAGELQGTALAIENKVIVESTGALTPVSIAADAEVVVSGKLASNSTTNAGTIIIKSGSISNAQAITNTGTIIIEDSEDFVKNMDSGSSKYSITGAAGIVTAEVATAAQFAAVLGIPSSPVNNITLKGGSWKVVTNPSAANDIAVTEYNAVGITLDGASFTIGNNAGAGDKDLVVKGNSSITGALTLKAKDLKVDEGATLTIAKSTTLEVAENAKVTILGTVINNGTMKATATGFIIEVGKEDTKNHTKHAALLKNNDASAVIGTQSTAVATITNYGTVSFKVGKAYGSITNKDAAVFEGNFAN